MRLTGVVEAPKLAHGEPADWENGAKAEFSPWPNGLLATPPPQPPLLLTPPPPLPPPPPPPPTPPPAKLGAERPRFHSPDEDGLKWDEQLVGLGGPPLPLDHGEEKVEDAGDLLALMTPGKRKFEGELGPERGVVEDVVKLGLR